MKPILTTITPYWNRPDQLLTWIKAIHGASIPEVKHYLYFVGETPPAWWSAYVALLKDRMFSFNCDEKPGQSIGHYHNLGATWADTEWVMKMDVDAIPNTRYFHELVSTLKSAKPREWFNGGMKLVSKSSSDVNLAPEHMPLSEKTYQRMMSSAAHIGSGARGPQSTNFICRRVDYLTLGGCDERFQGWGWEDYQQIYMLEKYQIGSDPLPGEVNFGSVTHRCRNEIAIPKAHALLKKSSWLCLFHRYHPIDIRTNYKAHADANRHILLDYILKQKKV